MKQVTKILPLAIYANIIVENVKLKYAIENSVSPECITYNYLQDEIRYFYKSIKGNDKSKIGYSLLNFIEP